MIKSVADQARRHLSRLDTRNAFLVAVVVLVLQTIALLALDWLA